MWNVIFLHVTKLWQRQQASDPCECSFHLEQIRTWSSFASCCGYEAKSAFLPFFSRLQVSRASGVSAEELKAEGKAPAVALPGPEILGEPGRPAGHRYFNRCHWEARQSSPHLHQRTWDPSHHDELVKDQFRDMIVVFSLMPWPRMFFLHTGAQLVIAGCCHPISAKFIWTIVDSFFSWNVYIFTNTCTTSDHYWNICYLKKTDLR